MKFEELKALALAVEPLPTGAEGPGGCEQVVAYNDLVSRFRERVTRALNNLSLHQAVDPALKRELRILGEALPDVRCRAEAAARRKRPESARGA